MSFMLNTEITSTMEKRRYYTVQDMAHLLSMHPQSIYRKVQRGTIPFLRGPGMRVIRFDADEIHEWMKQRKVYKNK